MSLGERIKKRRQELGMCQQALATLIGVRRATITELERGTRTVMGTDTAKALARALGVGIDYLVGTWEDEEAKGEPAAVA